MYCDFELYFQDLIDTINELKDKSLWENLISIIGVFGPMFISGLALFISIRSEKNTASIQKKISTTEERAFKRQVVLEAYGLFLNHDISFMLKNESLRVPNLAKNISLQISSRRFQMLAAFNKVRLITMGDESESAKNLTHAIKNALSSYEQLDDKVSQFVRYGDCTSFYHKALDELRDKYGPSFAETELFNNSMTRSDFVSYTNCDSINEINKSINDYILRISDNEFDVYFKKYIDEL